MCEEALCTAPATQRGAAATAATIRAAAPSGSSVYCACHTKRSRGDCGDNPRRSSFRKLCVLRLPHKEEPRSLRRQSAPQLLQEALRTAPATQQGAAATAAQVLQEALRTAPATQREASAPQLRQEALRTAPATRRGAAATAATIRTAAPSGSSVYCACHTKRGRGHCGDNPRRSSVRKLCVLRLHKFQRGAAATAATIRAAAPSGSSVYCACHTKRSRGHCGDNPRRSSVRKLCLLRLPHKEEPRPLRRQSAPQLRQEALCTARAAQNEMSGVRVV